MWRGQLNSSLPQSKWNIRFYVCWEISAAVGGRRIGLFLMSLWEALVMVILLFLLYHKRFKVDEEAQDRVLLLEIHFFFYVIVIKITLSYLSHNDHHHLYCFVMTEKQSMNASLSEYYRFEIGFIQFFLVLFLFYILIFDHSIILRLISVESMI